MHRAGLTSHKDVAEPIDRHRIWALVAQAQAPEKAEGQNPGSFNKTRQQKETLWKWGPELIGKSDPNCLVGLETISFKPNQAVETMPPALEEP